MERSEIIKRMVELIEHSLLPELLKDFGSSHIESEMFDEFRQTLDINLVNLFDMLQKYDYLLDSTENEMIGLKSKLILLICEQTSPNTLYQIKNVALIDNLKVLTDKHFLKILNNDPKIEIEIINTYKINLKQETWRKHIALACGFSKFLELRYSKNKYMDTQFSTFVLSVGLLLRDHFDPFFKAMGIRMFGIILKSSVTEKIKETNIHRVIYEETFQDISKFDNVEDIENVWNVLYDSLKLMDQVILNNNKWNIVDSFLKALIDQINFAKSSEIWLKLFQFIPKVCIFNHSKEDKILEIMNNNDTDYVSKIIAIRNCELEPSPTAYRWVKTFLEFFIAESNYLMGRQDVALDGLNTIHITYLICVFPISLVILQPHMINFYEKFILILMEMVRTHTNDNIIKQNVKQFIQTFQEQLKTSNNISTEFKQCQNNFDKILKNLFPN